MPTKVGHRDPPLLWRPAAIRLHKRAAANTVESGSDIGVILSSGWLVCLSELCFFFNYRLMSKYMSTAVVFCKAAIASSRSSALGAQQQVRYLNIDMSWSCRSFHWPFAVAILRKPYAIVDDSSGSSCKATPHIICGDSP
jgi:hypothetical protein